MSSILEAKGGPATTKGYDIAIGKNRLAIDELTVQVRAVGATQVADKVLGALAAHGGVYSRDLRVETLR